MLMNMSCGANLELDIVSGSMSLTNSRLIVANIPVQPLAVVLRITAGNTTSISTYYRKKPSDEFTEKVSSPAGVVTAQVYGETINTIFFSIRNVSAANPAQLEYYILGVKK